MFLTHNKQKNYSAIRQELYELREDKQAQDEKKNGLL